MIEKLTLMLLCSSGIWAMTQAKLDIPLTIKLSTGTIVTGSVDHTVRTLDAEGNRSSKALSLLGEEHSIHEALLFDFETYPHLREPYRSLPAMIKNILEPFITNSEESHEL